MPKDTNFDALKAAQETLRQSAKTLGNMDARDDARDKINDETPDTLVQKVKDMIISARRINKVYGAVSELCQRVAPYVEPVLRPVKWTGGAAKDIFNYAAYERDGKGMKLDADGDPVFSPGRLARSFAVAACIGLSANVGVHAGYYYGTEFNETVYVTGKQEIEKGELYQFTGCTSLPCSSEADNGKYYQIQKSWILPHLIYPEQNVFANIPQQNAACDIHGYGIYFKQLKPIFKWAEWYQNVDDVNCRPYTSQEIEAAVSTGHILHGPTLHKD